MANSYSQDFGGSRSSQMQPEEQYIESYGMHFCGSCKNLMTPSKDLGEKLQFQCKICKGKEVDFTKLKNEQCIIYNKELKPGQKKSVADEQFCYDPTMMKVNIICEDCGDEGAIMMISPGQNESCIQAKLICCNVVKKRCDKIWVLPIQEFIYKNQVIDESQFKELDVE